MIRLLKSIANMFTISRPQVTPIEDPTIYQIETSIRKYCGKIIYQDDMMIKLKIAKPKAVKILKSNIDRITIVQTETARQYYQWQNTKATGIINEMHSI